MSILIIIDTSNRIIAENAAIEIEQALEEYHDTEIELIMFADYVQCEFIKLKHLAEHVEEKTRKMNPIDTMDSVESNTCVCSIIPYVKKRQRSLVICVTPGIFADSAEFSRKLMCKQPIYLVTPIVNGYNDPDPKWTNICQIQWKYPHCVFNRKAVEYDGKTMSLCNYIKNVC